MALATTRAALLRGSTTENVFGDEVVDNSGAAIVADWDDFPVSIIERETREFDAASNAWRTVRYFAGRVPSDLPVDDGDRIRDNVTGDVYAIVSFKRARRSLAGRAYTTIKLRRTTP